MYKCIKKIFVFQVILMLAVVTLPVIKSNALSYSGKGSKSSPYLVETTEQLLGISKNLSGNYKLANTIDLGNAPLTPIGSVKSPFTGTLSCDVGKDGKPLYAILNANVNITPVGATKADGYTGYKKDGSSGWEAGLFGCAEGATFKNILVLQSSIQNTAEGSYSMNSDYTLNPGMDEQAAAIILAIGKNVTFSGCGVSGTVTSSSNHVGGMVGYLNGGKVTNCYSFATVTSTGAWGSGGLIGSAKDAVISSCFYSGVFSGGATHAGAFGGDLLADDITVKDCWASGTVKTQSSGCFLGTKVHADSGKRQNVEICTNCYTLAKIEGRTKAQTNKKVTNKNYVSDEVGSFEIGFAVANMDEINAAFTGLGQWTVAAGTYPQLKNVHQVTDASVYKVNAVSQQTEPGSTQSQTDETTSETVSELDETEQGGKDAEYKVETVFKGSTVNLGKTEMIFAVVLISIVGLTLVAGIAAFVLSYLKIRKLQKKDYGNIE